MGDLRYPASFILLNAVTIERLLPSLWLNNCGRRHSHLVAPPQFGSTAVNLSYALFLRSNTRRTCSNSFYKASGSLVGIAGAPGP